MLSCGNTNCDPLDTGIAWGVGHIYAQVYVYYECMDAVIVRIIDMPVGVKGITVKDAEGDYNIYLNARYSPDAQAVAFRHEVEHIKRGDFYRSGSVADKESTMPF